MRRRWHKAVEESCAEALWFIGQIRQLYLIEDETRDMSAAERKVVRLHDGLKELVDSYLSLKKSLAKEPSPVKLALLFFRGMILCENEESLRLVKKIDPIDVRRLMKQANPDLFAEFLTSVVAASAKPRAT